MKNNNIVFKAKELNLGYKVSSKNNKIVLKDINFELKKGELTALLGANGVGKSTLIKTLCGFIEPISGELLFEGEKINCFSKKELAKKIGVVLTERNSEGGFTVFEMVSLGRYPYTGFFGTLTDTDNAIINDSIEKIGITHLSERYISELSDGERQKVVIAKSLAQECPVIILDEPTAFLDLKSKVEITSLLRDLAQRENKCIIMSTHDLELSLQLSDKLFVISKETPPIYGTTEDLVLDGKLNNIFGEKNNSVEFDNSIGMFKSVKKENIPITVSGEMIPLFWLKNALLRNRLSPSSDKCEIEIVANSARNFSVTRSGKTDVYDSIEAVIKALIQTNQQKK